MYRYTTTMEIWVSKSLFYFSKCVLLCTYLYCIHSSRCLGGFACSSSFFFTHVFFFSWLLSVGGAPLDGNKMENRTFHFLTPDRNTKLWRKSQTDFSVSIWSESVFLLHEFFFVAVRVRIYTINSVFFFLSGRWEFFDFFSSSLLKYQESNAEWNEPFVLLVMWGLEIIVLILVCFFFFFNMYCTQSYLHI